VNGKILAMLVLQPEPVNISYRCFLTLRAFSDVFPTTQTALIAANQGFMYSFRADATGLSAYHSLAIAVLQQSQFHVILSVTLLRRFTCEPVFYPRH
jgi:hypothetical protein